MPTIEFWPLPATKCSTSTPSSSTPIWFRSACWRTTIVRSTASRRARNSDSERIAGRRRPCSRPSRRRCRLASRRVEPLTPLTSSSLDGRFLASPSVFSRTWVTVFGGSSGVEPSPESSELRRRRRRRRRERPGRGRALGGVVGRRRPRRRPRTGRRRPRRRCRRRRSARRRSPRRTRASPRRTRRRRPPRPRPRPRRPRRRRSRPPSSSSASPGASGPGVGVGVLGSSASGCPGPRRPAGAPRSAGSAVSSGVTTPVDRLLRRRRRVPAPRPRASRCPGRGRARRGRPGPRRSRP